MTLTAAAGDDRDREIAALRAEVAALRQEVASLRVVKLGSDAPEWQMMIYPNTAPWAVAAAAQPQVTRMPIQNTAAWQSATPFATSVCAGAGMAQTYTVLGP